MRSEGTTRYDQNRGHNINDTNFNFHHPQQVLLDDLTSVIDGTLITAFVTAIHLLRKRSITLATLAHALSVAFLVVAIGHYVERHVIGLEGVENLVRRGPGRKGFADWSSAVVLSVAAVAVLVYRFWDCKGVGVDCIVGDAAPLHYPCKMLKLRFFAPVFSATVAFVYACISSRLNALLGGSVLHPQGGGYAWAVLASPTLVSTLCISGCISVLLYSILVEAQGGCFLPRGRGTGCASDASGYPSQYEAPVGGVSSAHSYPKINQIQVGGTSDVMHPGWAASHGDMHRLRALSSPNEMVTRQHALGAGLFGRMQDENSDDFTQLARIGPRRRGDAAVVWEAQQPDLTSPNAPLGQRGDHSYIKQHGGRVAEHNNLPREVGEGSEHLIELPDAIDLPFLPFPGDCNGRVKGCPLSQDTLQGQEWPAKRYPIDDTAGARWARSEQGSLLDRLSSRDDGQAPRVRSPWGPNGPTKGPNFGRPRSESTADARHSLWRSPANPQSKAIASADSRQRTVGVLGADAGMMRDARAATPAGNIQCLQGFSGTSSWQGGERTAQVRVAGRSAAAGHRASSVDGWTSPSVPSSGETSGSDAGSRRRGHGGGGTSLALASGRLIGNPHGTTPPSRPAASGLSSGLVQSKTQCATYAAYLGGRGSVRGEGAGRRARDGDHRRAPSAFPSLFPEERRVSIASLTSSSGSSSSSSSSFGEEDTELRGGDDEWSLVGDRLQPGAAKCR